MIRCLSPYSVKHNGIMIDVRCRNCRLCRVSRCSEWKFRVWHEFLSFGKKGIFVTLTYSDDYLPVGGSLVKSDFQKFIKRVRKRCIDRKLKYFGAGEYGSNFGRPHYHAILLGLDFSSQEDLDVISKSWSNGFVKCGFVDTGSIQYVAKYLMKRCISNNPDIVRSYYSGKLPEFQVQSQGMGLNYIKEVPSAYKEFCFRFRDKSIPLFPFYRRKLRVSGEEFRRKYEEDIKLGKVVELTSSEVIATAMAIKRSELRNDVSLLSRESSERKRVVLDGVLRHMVDVRIDELNKEKNNNV